MTNLEIFALRELAKLTQKKINNGELQGQDLLEALTFINYVGTLRVKTANEK